MRLAFSGMGEQIPITADIGTLFSLSVQRFFAMAAIDSCSVARIYFVSTNKDQQARLNEMS
jgi:hypothetical protein